MVAPSLLKYLDPLIALTVPTPELRIFTSIRTEGGVDGAIITSYALKSVDGTNGFGPRRTTSLSHVHDLKFTANPLDNRIEEFICSSCIIIRKFLDEDVDFRCSAS